MTEEITSNSQIVLGTKIYTTTKALKKEVVSVFTGKIFGTTEIAVKIYSRNRLDENDYKFESEVLKFFSGKTNCFLKYFGGFKQGSQYFIVTEYIPFTLESLIANMQTSGDRFRREEIEMFMKDLLEAFEFIVSERIYHRDISSKNILVTETYQLKVIDFSNSIILNRVEGENNQQNYRIIDLSEYSAPELVRLRGTNPDPEAFFPYDLEKSDVFSLGLIFLQLATMADIAGLHNSPEAIQNLIGTIEWNLIKTLLERMLRPDPANRPNFLGLLESFTGKKIKYPIGTYSNSSSFTLLREISKNPDGIQDFLAVNNTTNQNLTIRFFQETNKEHMKNCNCLVRSLSKIQLEFDCFPLFYGAFIQEQMVWVLFEDCGSSIEEIIATRALTFNYFTESELFNYFSSLLYGLVFCADQKVFHNNISPSNIFVTSSGKIKFGNFALPFFDREEDLNPTLKSLRNSEENSNKNYLAPEIVDICLSIISNTHAGAYSKGLADVYSLGLVFYEMATLKKAVSFNLRRHSVEVFSKIDLISQTWAKQIIKGMLDYSPESRLTAFQVKELLPLANLS